VLREALGNLRLKGTPDGVARFYALLGDLRAELVEIADGGPRDLPRFVAPKDRHVIAACPESGAHVCLTLDRRHRLTDEIRRWGMGIGLRLLTPGELLARVRLDQNSG
jgi:hypothetical protein